MAKLPVKNVCSISLLQRELGAIVVEVRDRTGKILWQKSQHPACGYQPEGIDSESQQVRDNNDRKDQRNGY